MRTGRGYSTVAARRVGALGSTARMAYAGQVRERRPPGSGSSSSSQPRRRRCRTWTTAVDQTVELAEPVNQWQPTEAQRPEALQAHDRRVHQTTAARGHCALARLRQEGGPARRIEPGARGGLPNDEPAPSRIGRVRRVNGRAAAVPPGPTLVIGHPAAGAAEPPHPDGPRVEAAVTSLVPLLDGLRLADVEPAEQRSVIPGHPVAVLDPGVGLGAGVAHLAPTRCGAARAPPPVWRWWDRAPGSSPVPPPFTDRAGAEPEIARTSTAQPTTALPEPRNWHTTRYQ